MLVTDTSWKLYKQSIPALICNRIMNHKCVRYCICIMHFLRKFIYSCTVSTSETVRTSPYARQHLITGIFHIVPSIWWNAHWISKARHLLHDCIGLVIACTSAAFRNWHFVSSEVMPNSLKVCLRGDSCIYKSILMDIKQHRHINSASDSSMLGFVRYTIFVLIIIIIIIIIINVIYICILGT